MRLEEKVRSLPQSCGVYLFKDASGKILYVGKAANLAKRVRNYFQVSRLLTPKLSALLSQIEDLDYEITDNEVEALLLECNLIKEYHPRYNVSLKDDKRYPYLKITKEDFHRIFVTRKVKNDGAKYFGPYTNAKALRQTLKLLRTLFPIRTCKRKIVTQLPSYPVTQLPRLKGTNRQTGKLANRQTGQPARPCLNYYIKRCFAPCAGKISKEEYRKVVDEVGLFLKGEQDRLIKRLEKRMKGAKKSLKFEEAIILRDQIRSLEKISARQKVVSTRPIDQDVIAFALGPDSACSQIFSIRKGKLIGGEHFFLKGIKDKSKEEILTPLVKQYYYNATYIPKEVVLQNEIEEKELIKSYLEKKGKRKVKLLIPKRGDKLKLIKLAERNARLALTQKYSASQQMKEEALGELQRTLGLKELPFRIEAFDISNISGILAAGSLVVFKGGEPEKNEYRRFRIKRSKKADDYAMMSEVIERRYRRLLKERKIMPDLILVDGGKGQLSAALKVLKRLKIKLPVAALAKEYEHLFIPGKSLPIMLAKNSSALYLLKQIRDEAHRFALAYHRKLRKKKMGLALTIIIFALIILPSHSTWADIVHLKSGGRIEGKVIKKTKDKITVETNYGSLTFNRNQITSVEYKPFIKKIIKKKKERKVTVPPPKSTSRPSPTGKLLSADFTNAPLSKVLTFLAEKYGKSVVISATVLYHNVTLSVKNATWKEILDEIAEQTGIKYEIKGNVIHIYSQEEWEAQEEAEENETSLQRQE